MRSQKTSSGGTNRIKRMGLARALSKLGFCSRSQAFGLIREGKVRLNGARPRNPETAVRLSVDHIEVDRQRIDAAKKVGQLVLLVRRSGGSRRHE